MKKVNNEIEASFRTFSYMYRDMAKILQSYRAFCTPIYGEVTVLMLISLWYDAVVVTNWLQLFKGAFEPLPHMEDVKKARFGVLNILEGRFLGNPLEMPKHTSRIRNV